MFDSWRRFLENQRREAPQQVEGNLKRSVPALVCDERKFQAAVACMDMPGRGGGRNGSLSLGDL
jgi:hypothetical protein